MQCRFVNAAIRRLSTYWVTATCKRIAFVGVGSCVASWALLASIANAVELQSGLIAYWNLDETTGPTLFDTAPAGVNPDHGTLASGSAMPTRISGKFGAALSFDGVDDYADIPASTDLNIGTNRMSLSAWVNLDLLPNQIPGSFGPIYDSTIDAYNLYLDKGNNELRFKLTDTNYHAARPGIPTSALSTGTWHHVAAVYDGTGSVGTVKIYWDGVLKDTHTGNDGTGTGLTGNVLPGQVAKLGTTGGFYAGDLDDVGIWNRALSASEIAYIANGGAGRTLTEVAPVIHWRFDGTLANSGTGGAAYDATVVDGPGGSNGFAAGRRAQALDLENTPGSSTDGDYVSVNYTLPEEGTISLWYKPEPWYNYQTIFDNSVHNDDWEFWIYADGNARFRVTRGTTGVTYDLDNLGGPGQWYHMAVTWDRNGSNVDLQLFVNGLLRQSATTAWSDPGTSFFLGGGHNGNTYGNGLWDDVRIYERVLTADQIYGIAYAPEPGSLALVLLGGLALVIGRVKFGSGRRASTR